MAYFYSKRKRHKMKSGEKKVLIYSIPATIVIAIIIQITIKGLPNFYDSIISKIQEEAAISSKIIAKEMLKNANKQGSIDGKLTKTARVNENDRYRKAEKETWDATYQEIQEKELKEDIKNYRQLFENEKKTPKIKEY